MISVEVVAVVAADAADDEPAWGGIESSRKKKKQQSGEKMFRFPLHFRRVDFFVFFQKSGGWKLNQVKKVVDVVLEGGWFFLFLE